jgi:hypothetical protein
MLSSVRPRVSGTKKYTKMPVFKTARSGTLEEQEGNLGSKKRKSLTAEEGPNGEKNKSGIVLALDERRRGDTYDKVPAQAWLGKDEHK